MANENNSESSNMQREDDVVPGPSNPTPVNPRSNRWNEVLDAMERNPNGPPPYFVHQIRELIQSIDERPAMQEIRRDAQRLAEEITIFERDEVGRLEPDENWALEAGPDGVYAPIRYQTSQLKSQLDDINENDAQFELVMEISMDVMTAMSSGSPQALTLEQLGTKTADLMLQQQNTIRDVTREFAAIKIDLENRLNATENTESTPRKRDKVSQALRKIDKKLLGGKLSEPLTGAVRLTPADMTWLNNHGFHDFEERPLKLNNSTGQYKVLAIHTPKAKSKGADAEGTSYIVEIAGGGRSKIGVMTPLHYKDREMHIQENHQQASFNPSFIAGESVEAQKQRFSRK